MTDKRFAFLFEEARLSPDEGAVDPAEEHFEGSTAAQAAVRETGQNSLDARRPDLDGPVRMEFELASMATAAIPGIEGLRSNLRQVVEATKGQMGHDRMVRALEMAERDELPVLRISDFGTSGLTGAEGLVNSATPLSRLTRGSGNSADDGIRGGSFGIGSAAGRVASTMATVLYRSLPHDAKETVFAGFSRLATHDDAAGVRRRAAGIFTRLDVDDFEYLRPAPTLAPFADRTEPGTDIFVLGFRMAQDDPNLLHIRDAAIDNFMVAIDRGRLEVTGITAGSRWHLDASTIEGFAKRDPRMAAFYKALKDPTPDVAELPDLGRVELYVNIDDTLDRSLHVVTMRKPLMRIATYTYRSVRAKYAAITICADDAGNTLLRRLEPPQHDKWDPQRSPEDGPRAIKALGDFIRDRLRARVSEGLGQTVEIKGLEQFLPSVGIAAVVDGDAGRPDSLEPPTAEESSTVTGSTQPIAVRQATRRAVAVPVARPAIAGAGDDDVTKGRDTGGPGKRRSGKKGLPGKGKDGDGGSRIGAGDVTFRSWSQGINGDGGQRIALALTAHGDIEGDLELVPLGPGGAPESGYDLQILQARLNQNGSTSELSYRGNTLKGLALSAGATTRVELVIPSNIRYRLGVA